MADYNREPYFDDYDEDKNFLRILFRPGYAVQTRELTQLQTMLQKQIERHGKHIFREGTIVLGGGFDLQTDIEYVKIENILPSEDSLSQFVGQTIEGETSGVRANVRAVDTDEENGNQVLFVRYTSSSGNNDRFLPDETLDVVDTSITADVLSSADNPIGKGTIFSIDDGVLFSKGFFISFERQTVVVSRYDTEPNATIGFFLTESIVTPAEDPSLLDNAQGTFNFTAPGAHRLAIDAQLAVVDVGAEEENPDFNRILDVRNGEEAYSRERTEYSRIYEEIAKRTYDESGDFYVRGFTIRSREYLDTGQNEGYLAANKIPDDADQDVKDNPENYLSLDVEPGLAYVKGFEVNTDITRHIITEKSLTFNSINDQVLSARTGGFILINEVVGTPPLDDGAVVQLYDTAEQRITNQTKNTVSPTGSSLGTARVKSVLREEGDLGIADTVYRLYLFDFDITGDLSDIRAVYNASTSFFADTVLDTSSNTRLRGIADNDLIFKLGTKHTRRIRDEQGQTDTSFIFHRTDNTSLNLDSGNGEISIQIGTTNETFPYSDGILSVDEKRDFIVSINGDQDFPLAGTVDTTSGSTTVIGVSTQFTNLNPGDRIKVTDGSTFETRIISEIVSDLELEVTENFTTSYNNDDFIRAYFSGDLIDLTNTGSNGNTRTVTISGNSTSASIDLQEDVSDASVTGTVNAVVNYKLQRSNAEEIEKKLRPSRFVKIDCSSLGSLTDPIDLGFSDVREIRQIRIDTAAFTDSGQGSDVTNQFAFDNGQRDNFYGHAKITPGITLTTSNYLLVELDYFEPIFSGSFGYFSIDSYPIDDTQETDTTIFTYEIPTYTNTGSIVYNLRDCLDFRPVRQNTANDATDVASATTNPTSSSSFISDTNGLRIAEPNSRIDLDYSYYLARRDVITLDKEGQFSVVNGEPDETPRTPNISDNKMSIANVYIPPFPSISETLGRTIDRRDIAVTTKKVANIRHTHRDVGVLKQRIDNLEYYNSLSLLEKSATDLEVLDENGLDRFKNGFFVDGFLDHSLGDTQNPDYNIAVDKVEKVMRPKFDMNSFKYDVDPAQLSGLQRTGNLVTLPYTEETLLEQLAVTTTRNIEQSVFRFIGVLELSPDTDVWADTNTVDKHVEFGNDLEDTMFTDWGSWETNSSGYDVHQQEGSWSGLELEDGELRADADHVGSFSSYAAALSATKRQAEYTDDGAIEGILETTNQQSRTGIQTNVTYEKETQELGNFVTDVSLIPYIRPQEITLYAQGMKARTRYYVFFDGEDMTDFVTPYTIPSDGNLGNATLGNEGDEIRADDFGDVYAILRLPASGKRFRVGDREVVITDSPTNDPETVSYAEEHFYASGLDVQKQNTILSTKHAVISRQETAPQERVQQVTERVGPSCMAYSFLVDVPAEEEGIFLTSVDVFIQSMDPDLGVWFEIREMNSAGGITRAMVPYSKVWMKRDDPRINFWDGTGTPVPTKVDFESPVFLYNDTQYAFVIHTEGLNPNTYFWVSRLGEEDILTGENVTGRQLTGTLFTTNNNVNYDIVPDLDLMVRFNRADFQTQTQGQAVLGNEGYEFLNVSVPSSPFNIVGEEVQGSDRLTLSNISGSDTIVVGDVILGTDSSAAGTVTNIDGSDYETDGFDFDQGEAFTVEDSGGTAKDTTGTVSQIDRGTGNLYEYDSNENELLVSNSNRNFFASGRIRGEQSDIVATISSFYSYPYSTSNLKPDFLSFNDASVTFEKRGFNLDTNSYTPYVSGKPNGSSSYREELVLISASQEQDILGGPNLQSSQVRATMFSQSPFVSPVIDLSRAHSVYVHNLVNSDVTNENESSGGDLINKYITKIVTLGEDQDAEDLVSYLSVYRPPVLNSEIKVWYRIKHREDEESIRNKNWVEMVNEDPGFSSIANRNNFIESEFVIPESEKNASGIVTYDSNGATFEGFKQFQIKIGILGDDSAIVPRIADLRVIGLQV